VAADATDSVGVLAKLAEVQENLELIDHKIDVYRSRLAAGARWTMNLRQWCWPCCGNDALGDS